MNALIVYESMYGNTERIAQAIADGLAERLTVTLADVSTMPRALGMDLLVVGGPTHAFSMSRPSTREQAAEQGTVRDRSGEVGIREYLDCSPTLAGMSAAAFGTKLDKRFLPGSAAHVAQRQLRRMGCRIVLPAQNFLVRGSAGPLEVQEENNARRWGATLAATVLNAQHTV